MNKLLIYTGIICVLLLISNIVEAQKSKTNWLDGEWTGLGFQPASTNKCDTWDIDLKYDFKTGEFKINYPSFPCGGYWKLLDADNNKATFIEYITEGKDLCLNEETIVVTKIDDNYITVSYFLAKEYDGVISFSTLKKKKDKDKK